MSSLLRGPWIISRLRAALLVLVGAAAVLDLVTFVALVTDGDDRPGPDVVALEVIRAVADDDCGDLDDLLADDADLPGSVTRCLAGGTSTADLSDVRVVATTTDGDSAAVTIGVAADGLDSQVVVDLRRDDDGAWLVTGIRPA